jgi:hypothetical protein
VFALSGRFKDTNSGLYSRRANAVLVFPVPSPFFCLSPPSPYTYYW